MEFYRELGTAPLDHAEAVLRRWWCEAMLDTDPEADQIRKAALEGTLPVTPSQTSLPAESSRACPLSESEKEGWPCHFSNGVAELLADPQISPTLFSAIVALSVEINETRGDISGQTASAQWPQQLITLVDQRSAPVDVL